MNPGATALTRTLRDPNSCASDFVSPITPAFEATYALCPAFPVSATTEVTLIIEPLF